jgi:hypothetical protein
MTNHTTYKIQELEQGSTEWITVDNLRSKVKAEFYLKEYQAYKQTSQFRLLSYTRF